MSSGRVLARYKRMPDGKARLARFAIVTVSAAGVGGYLFHLHREGKRWGATDEETRANLPGDDLVPHPDVETTHAVTINAPAKDVWPWLVQMGYGRAGWYTDVWWYRQIDRYVWRVRTLRTNAILPELQRLAVGDTVPDGPPGTAYFTVTACKPGHTLALYSTTHPTVWLPAALRDNKRLGLHGELSWVFELRELEPSRTRLILRGRLAAAPAAYRWLAGILWPLADGMVAPMMLLHIKQRVERLGSEAEDQQRARGDLEVGQATVTPARVAIFDGAGVMGDVTQ